MTSRLSTAARLDFAAAFEEYERQRKGLGANLLDAIERTLALLSRFPLSGRSVGRSVRIMPVGHMGHMIVYQSKPGGILVLAMSKKQRPPEYWLKRAAPK
ncbi:type II toxin-antitoxin system RelE/ParE family toxin [Massilia cavernae]|uniref:Type II toxin-antitoxin system RelE/ParE family toxin n=1 Tax=Massilia cavernae TaxID=2320864 RepID=A0A418XS85_9BURK|nr:type II toxin-antitoxin system RelE/ParE family toxin [Massilia cavernae]RJG15414.1 type II toxin-antitoxin system RelE/ParE family toxin [Massilia cavernae]